MFDDTNGSAAPETSSGRKSCDTEVSNEQPKNRETNGNVESGKSNTEPLDRATDNNTEENVPVLKTAISARKLAANRENATHSTGPKTEQGKANSSKNAIKHGIYAAKLFSPSEEYSGENVEYDQLAAQLIDHYNPVGFKEQLLVERIRTELVRNGRILKFEQRVLSEIGIFLGGALEKVLRYSAHHDRLLSQLLKDLDEEQSKRRS